MKNRREIFGGLGNWMFQSAYIYSQWRKGYIPDLYVQDESHFRDFAEEIKALHKANIEPVDMVSLHIRRGDYVDNPFYVDLTQTDYYQKAVESFPEETEFLVFCADRQEGSDDEADRAWCAHFVEENLPKRKYWFHVGEDEIDDFNTMAGCTSHILANSTFSWWAAYVGGGKTVYPRNWYADGVERTKFTPQDNWTAL